MIARRRIRFAVLAMVLAVLLAPAQLAFANSPTQLCSEMPKPPEGDVVPTRADELVRLRQYSQAEALYQAIKTQRPTSTCAKNGLLRIAEAKAGGQVTLGEKLSSRWNSFYSDWLQPITSSVLVFLGVLLFLLVVARLATSVVVHPDARAHKSWDRVVWWLGLLMLSAAAAIPAAASSARSAAGGWWAKDVSTPWPPVVIAVGAVVLAVALAVGGQPWKTIAIVLGVMIALGILLFLAFGLPTHLPRRTTALWVLGSVLAVVGVIALAAARGLTLKLQVDARGSSGAADANASHFLIARLIDLGATPPKGLRTPQQTDVTALPDEALTALPQGPVVAALFNVLRAVRSAVPWRCTVTLLTDNDTAVVGLVRNGRPVDEVTRISRRDLGLPAIPLEGKGKERDDAITRAQGELLTAAAAVILTALSERHRELAHGLCGAKKWKSIARHAIATDQYHDQADVKKPLLEAAVDADQRNALARVALAHATAGDHPDDRKAESRLAGDLDREFRRIGRPQHSQLRLRLRQREERQQLKQRQQRERQQARLEKERQKLQDRHREERQKLQDRQRQEREERSAPERGYGGLELRLLYARATVWLNMHLLVEAQGLTEPSPQQAWESACLAARHLIYRLDEIPKRRRLSWGGEDANINELGSQLRPSASCLWQAIIDHSHGSALPEKDKVQNLIRDWSMKKWIPGSGPDPAIPPDKELLSRQACYDWACTLAIKPSADESTLQKALSYLEAAATDDGNRTWARRDPAFAVFRTTDTSPSDELRQRYKDAVGDPLPTDILTLPPLTQHADKLRAYGLTSCQRFSKTSSWRLASQVGVESSVARGWVELGTLACRLTTDDSKRIALLKLLTASEITDMQKLHTRLREDKEALYRQLVKNAIDLRIVPTRKETIEAWAKL